MNETRVFDVEEKETSRWPPLVFAAMLQCQKDPLRGAENPVTRCDCAAEG
jgi:hypothetical protein